jgi:hypothetical protein
MGKLIMSDEEYTKWKKKSGKDELEAWIELILNTKNPSDQFCIDAYNNKNELKRLKKLKH